MLLDSLAEVRRRDLDFVMAFGADGPMRSELERRAASAGLGTHVRFLEVAEHMEVLLAAADAVVFAMPDGPLPLTLLDAMVRGRPVVASAIASIADTIEDGIDGRLVPPGDAQALAEVLETLHRRPDTALRMGRAAAERVREDWLVCVPHPSFAGRS